jgi:GntR family transcriptional regulator
MQFRIEPSSRLPIYQQIVEQVREVYARGGLAPGEKLPSVRELSQTLVVNPNTIARAYSELERAGLLTTRQGLGVFIAEPSMELTSESRQRRLLESMDRFLTEAVHLGFSSQEMTSLLRERSRRYQWTPVETSTSEERS